MKKQKPKLVPVAPVTRESFETFLYPFGYFLNEIKKSFPSSFNGNVQVYKYRITAELVDEPKEVIAARLQELWDECDNHHHWDPIRHAAIKIGYELVGNPGSKRVK